MTVVLGAFFRAGTVQWLGLALGDFINSRSDINNILKSFSGFMGVKIKFEGVRIVFFSKSKRARWVVSTIFYGGEMIQFDFHIFQMGGFNHQPEEVGKNFQFLAVFGTVLRPQLRPTSSPSPSSTWFRLFWCIEPRWNQRLGEITTAKRGQKV